tara:strand:- start:5388 stop:5936 length:549 start_codon:yes stop_codon:yes gene_type:complete
MSDDAPRPSGALPPFSHDDWAMYLRQTEHGPAVVAFDALAAEVEPGGDEERPWPAGLRIEVEILDMDEHGLPAHELELQELAEVEELLEGLLAHHAIPAKLLAIVTVNGWREFLVALEKEGVADYVLRKLDRKTKERALQITTCEPFPFLREHVLPTDEEWQAELERRSSLEESIDTPPTAE